MLRQVQGCQHPDAQHPLPTHAVRAAAHGTAQHGARAAAAALLCGMELRHTHAARRALLIRPVAAGMVAALIATLIATLIAALIAAARHRCHVAQIHVRRSVPPEEYVTKIMSAKFCPICGGFSQWTPRLAEALYYEYVLMTADDR